MTCTSGYDSCGKIYFDGKVAGTGVEGYGKSCAIKSGCNKDLCKAMQAGIAIDKCEVNCCQGDLCNGAKVPLSCIETIRCTSITVNPVKTRWLGALHTGYELDWKREKTGYCHDHKSCYYCRTKSGWDDCSSRMEEITCPAEKDACAKLYFEGKLNYTDIKGYVKDCSVKSACNQDLCKTLQPGATFNKCEVHCCEGHGLECFKCVSSKSWDDCDSNKQVMTCPSSYDVCGKISCEGKSKGVPSKFFVEACLAYSKCNREVCRKVATKSVTIDKCHVTCCKSDLCNGAKEPMVSAFLLLACALAAFFR
ncbi:uncharacterized skeletal organic matrix protein 2-like [Porites lutea]|uniref:uncharacterized skeletal organic matrix protein 2-like n=1 Tax=Porites lutea TaxID=51062 RepID=UPI003CC54E27